MRLHTRNLQRYIYVNQIYSALCGKLAKTLLASLAFTGCDYAAFFSSKGKISPLKILEKDIRNFWKYG